MSTGSWRFGGAAVAALLVSMAVVPGAGRRAEAGAEPAGTGLPVVTQAGPAPKAEESIVVAITPTDGVTVDGQVAATLSDLKTAIEARAAKGKRDPDGASLLHLVVRAEEEAAWIATLWTLQIAAAPPARIERIHFAVKHKASGEEGVISTQLPKDKGLAALMAAASTPTLRVAVTARDDEKLKATMPEAVYAAVKAAVEKEPKTQIEIEAPPPRTPAVRHGTVVRILDAVLRAGAANVQFVGAAFPARKKGAAEEELKALLTRLAAMPRGSVWVKVGGEALVTDEAKPPEPIPDGTAPSQAKGAAPEEVGIPEADEPPPDTVPPAPVEKPAVAEKPPEVAPPTEKPAEPPAGTGEKPVEPKPPGEKPAEPAATAPPKPADVEAPAARKLLGADGKLAPAENEAVKAALEWLVAHQSPDEGWQAAAFGHWCDGEVKAAGGPEGAGKPQNDVAVTGLSLLAFLGAGHTTHSDSPTYAKAVFRGLRFLADLQDGEGCFGDKAPPPFLYAHAAATLAMVEAYGMTGDADWKEPAKKGVAFVLASRGDEGPWKHGPAFAEGAPSTTAWMLSVIETARLVNEKESKEGKTPTFTLDAAAKDAAKAWLEKAEASGASVFSRVLLGESPSQSDALKKAVAVLLESTPAWGADSGSVDLFHFLWGSLAAFQSGDDAWAKWHESLAKTLLAHQRKDKDSNRCGYVGSFDPVGAAGPEGGRVLSTALAALALETPWRTARKEPTPPPPK